jgi:hypothetical protein
MNKLKLRNFMLLAITMLLFGAISSCNSTESRSTTIPDTSLSPTPESPNVPPSKRQTFSSSCPIDTSEALSAIGNIPVDAFKATSMIFPLENAKQVLLRISSDDSCVAEKTRLVQNLKLYWRTYTILSYQRDVVVAESGIKMLCGAGCDMGDDNYSDCKIKCEQSYQSDLQKAQVAQQSEVQKMEGFFANIR